MYPAITRVVFNEFVAFDEAEKRLKAALLEAACLILTIWPFSRSSRRHSLRLRRYENVSNTLIQPAGRFQLSIWLVRLGVLL